MKNKGNTHFKQIAFVVSICLCVLWSVLGTGASLAWFTDSTTELKNVFHFAEFDLQLFHLTEEGKWEEVEQDTKLFDDEALYEPGYVQTVFLKVRNNGTVPFAWDTAVISYSNRTGINKFGDRFDLRDYLKFGIVENLDFETLKTMVRTRAQAVNIANAPLGEYYTADPKPILEATEGKNEKYIAIIVRMPEEVTNVANYVPPDQPEVKLSVVVSATQLKD